MPLFCLKWPNLAIFFESLFLIYFRSVDKSSAHLEIVFIKCINKSVEKQWFKQRYEIKPWSNVKNQKSLKSAEILVILNFWLGKMIVLTVVSTLDLVYWSWIEASNFIRLDLILLWKMLWMLRFIWSIVPCPDQNILRKFEHFLWCRKIVWKIYNWYVSELR